MTVYHSIEKANHSYKLTILCVLTAAFLIAMPLMFVHPTAVIMLVWLGLVVMAIAVPIEWLILYWQRSAARKALARHECPECGATCDLAAFKGDAWTCGECGTAFPKELYATRS